jgi:hypothetical protein
MRKVECRSYGAVPTVHGVSHFRNLNFIPVSFYYSPFVPLSKGDSGQKKNEKKLN